MESLQELQFFYEQSLCYKRFCYTLKNGKTIELQFYRDNFCHLLGIQHVTRDKSNLGDKGYAKIQDGTLTIKKLKAINKPGFSYIKNRIIYFPLIEHLLSNGSIFRFYQDRVRPASKIKADFLLHEVNNDVYLHLFLVKETSQRILFVPTSFIPLTAKNDNKKQYINFQEFKGISARKVIENP